MTSKNTRNRTRRRAPGAMLPGSLTVSARITTVDGEDALLDLLVGGVVRDTLDTDLDAAREMAEDIGRSSIAYLCGDFVVETADRIYEPVLTLREAVAIIWTARTEEVEADA